MSPENFPLKFHCHQVFNQERSANILIKGNVAKVADFGLSKILKENQYVSNSAAAFPVRYSAPEMVTGEKPASAFTDVWSYGTLIYEVLTYAQRPFRKYKTNSDVSENLVEVMLVTERDESMVTLTVSNID